MSKLIARRKFLTGAAAMTLLAGCEGHPTRIVNRLVGRWNESFEELMFSPTRLAPEMPASALTAEKDFPFFYHGPSVPAVPPNWTLKIGGLVKHPMVLTLDQLKAMPATAMRVTHYCVDGWTAVASWHGVRVSEIARIAILDPRVKYVEFRSFDNGYYAGWDIASALHPQTLLAYGMNGHEVSAGHGAPLRVYTAIKLGYMSVKYLTEVNFLPYKVMGTYADNGFDWFAGV